MKTKRSIIEGDLKLCPDCGQWLPLDGFYHGAKQIRTYCKKCDSARSARYSKAHPGRYRSSRDKWARNNPVKKRICEGRAIFFGRPGIPAILIGLELAVMKLGASGPRKNKLEVVR